jgi:excisionase family DNA binding protein
MELVAHLQELSRLPAVVLQLRREVEALRAEIERSKATPSGNLLDVNAAASLLSMTPRALRQAVYRRTIPAIRLGRRLRFRREDLLSRAAQAPGNGPLTATQTRGLGPTDPSR